MVTKQIIEGLRISISQLIPGVHVSTSLIPYEDLMTPGFKKYYDPDLENGVLCLDKSCIILWFKGILDKKVYFRIHRDGLPFSDFEQKLIKTVPLMIENFDDIHKREFIGFTLKFSTRVSFGDFIISKFLDEEANSGIWSYLSILLVLQELTFKRYEEQRCTSGFVCTNSPKEFIRHLAGTHYMFHKFQHKPKLNYTFFDSPATFRYVDGRNSFYLIDNNNKLHGVLRLKNPDTFSLIDRIGNLHLISLLYDLPGNNRITFVGLKDEVYVIMGKDQQLKWAKNHWHFRDRRIIFQLLDEYGFDSALSQLFVSTLFSLSELRLGSVILIPESNDELPPTIGKIDNSAYGILLRDSILATNILELKNTNSLLGILSSDGLTTVSKHGKVLSCGDIIDITRAGKQKIQGGGRSQASIASSYYGLAIKISQDGPVSFYRDGKLLIQM